MMNRWTRRRQCLWKVFLTAVFIAGSLNISDRARAHVSYIDLDATGGTATVDMTRFGWLWGTEPGLGNSHFVRYFKFHLDQPSSVDILVTGADELALNPAMTLYAGVLPSRAHDDTEFDPVNPTDASFNKIASPVDDGVTTDAFGRVSPFRDTANFDFDGQFNALGSWSMANDNGEWGVIEYLIHKNETPGNESLLGYLLPAGDYSIVAGGASCRIANNVAGCFPLPSINGTVTLRVSPVPVPAAAWLFGSGIVGLAGLAKRMMMASARV